MSEEIKTIESELSDEELHNTDVAAVLDDDLADEENYDDETCEDCGELVEDCSCEDDDEDDEDEEDDDYDEDEIV